MDSLESYVHGFAGETQPTVTVEDLAYIFDKGAKKIREMLNRATIKPSIPGSGTIPHQYRSMEVIPAIFKATKGKWPPVRHLQLWHDAD